MINMQINTRSDRAQILHRLCRGPAHRPQEGDQRVPTSRCWARFLRPGAVLPLRWDSDRHEGLGDADQKRPRGAATPGRQGARDCGPWTNFSPIGGVSSTNQHSERHDHSRAVVREHPRGVDPQVEQPLNIILYYIIHIVFYYII